MENVLPKVTYLKSFLSIEKDIENKYICVIAK